MDNTSNSPKYYCAGRHCTKRDICHRHTSSVTERNAQFEDYDLIYLRDGICKYFIDINNNSKTFLSTK